MKKTICKLIVFPLLLIIAIGIVSCGKNEALKNFKLKGTKWKLVGIVNAETEEMTELEPKGCRDCYTLKFNTDKKFTAYGINKKWNLNLLDLPFSNIYTTYLNNNSIYCEIYNKEDKKYCDVGNFYFGLISSCNYIYFSADQELRLYFDDYRLYSLFKPY